MKNVIEKKIERSGVLIIITTAVFVLFMMYLMSQIYNNEIAVALDNNRAILAVADVCAENNGINLSDRAGYYNGYYFVVKIYNRYDDNIEDTMFHEHAHYVQDTKFEFEEYMYYKDIFEEGSEFISQYAKTNSIEDFAENYAEALNICYNASALDSIDKDRKEFTYMIIDRMGYEECK